LLELSLGDWAHPDGKKLYNSVEHSQKKWPLFGRATNKKNVISVYQRTSYSANLSENPPKKKRSYSTPASE
jgi:hypothetical protein